MEIYDEIAAAGRKLLQNQNVKEVDIRVSFSNGSKILWDSYNDGQNKNLAEVKK